MKENKDLPFIIVTSHGEFKRHILILKALGYPIYQDCLDATSMGNFAYLQYCHEFREVMRSNQHVQHGQRFGSIEDFLSWYLDDWAEVDNRIKEIDIQMRSLELEKAGLIAKKTGAVC